MRKSTVIFVVALMVIFTLFMRAATAQGVDSDGDGIKDSYDACPGTISADYLPIIKIHTELLGCSCEQIQEKLAAQKDCIHLYCFAQTPLDIQELTQSSKPIECGADYCIGNTLYDFPQPGIVSCSNGFPPQGICTPSITNNSEKCITGEVPQKNQQASPTENNPPAQTTIDIYDVVLENSQIRSFLGNPTRQQFMDNSDSVMSELTILRNITQKRIGKSNATIPFITVTVLPKPGKVIDKAAIIEQVNGDIKPDSFIFYGQQPLRAGHNTFIWLFDNTLDNGISVSYQVNEPVEVSANTMIVGVVKNRSWLVDWWPILLVPVIAYLSYLYIVSKKE